MELFLAVAAVLAVTVNAVPQNTVNAVNTVGGANTVNAVNAANAANAATLANLANAQALGANNLAALGAVDLSSIFTGPVSGNPRCRRNEIFLTCGPGCTLTCGNFLQLTTCTATCRPGCFCADGTVRDELNGGLCVNPFRCRRWRLRRPIHSGSSSEEDSRSRSDDRRRRDGNRRNPNN